jgi:hypothetical protein
MNAKGKIIFLWALFVVGTTYPLGCGQTDDSTRSATDDRAGILAKWKTIMPMLPDDFLLVYVEASRMLIAEGIDATYIFKWGIKDVKVDAPPGVTFLAIDLYSTEIQLHAPPPSEVLVLMEEKLKHRKPRPLDPLEVWSSRGKKQGSTAVLAGDVWRKAEMKIHKKLQDTKTSE